MLIMNMKTRNAVWQYPPVHYQDHQVSRTPCQKNIVLFFIVKKYSENESD